MQIITPPDFLHQVKDTHILLDTSIFIDTAIHFREFSELLDKLKNYGATLVTVSAVKGEFLEGAANKEDFDKKLELIDGIIDTCLPVSEQIYESVFEIIRQYGQEGKGKGPTDFLLGGMLHNYTGRLMLLTKNCTDFPIRIFNLETYFNVVHSKGIHVYGVYSYKK